MSVSLKVKIFDNKGTRILQVAKSTLTIGSASHCDVVFDDASVAAEHTRVWLESGRIWVQDLGGGAGTSLNDIRLPALKPMLVRDLDVLRLGENPSTIGLEAIAVRAPVVKPKPVQPVSPSAPAAAAHGPSAAEIEKRKEEAEKLSREVADLRLQLQMAQLEKNSSDDIAQQLASLRAETERVHEQKAKWDESLRKLEAERQVLRKEIDKELLEFKAKALKDLKKVVGAEAEVQVQVLNQEIEKMRAQMEKVNSEVSAARAEISRLTALKAELTEKLNKAEAESERLRSDLKANEAAAGQRHGTALRKLNEEKDALANRLRLAEEEKQSLYARLEQVETTHSFEINSEIKKLNEQKVKLSESLRKAESEREALRAELERSESEAKTVVAQSSRTVIEIEKLQDLRAKLTESLRKAEEEREALRAELKRTESEAKTVVAQSSQAGSEIQKLHEQRAKLTENLRKVEAERDSLRAELRKSEDGATQLTRNLRQLEQEKDALAQHMEKTVVAQTSESEVELKRALDQKNKLADTIRKLEAEREVLKAEIKSMKSDLGEKFKAGETERESLRRAIEKDRSELKTTKDAYATLKESYSALKESMAALKESVALRESTAKQKAAVAANMEQGHSREERRARRRQAKASANMWRMIGLTSLVLAMILAGVWFSSLYLRGHGSRSLSSTGAGAQTGSGTKSAANVPRKPEKPKRFEPKVGKKYRASYTENVLYLENYVAAEENSDFRKKWLTELAKTATNDWKVDAWSLSPVGVEELAMIRELDKLKSTINADKEEEGLERMHERENKFLRDLESVFKTRAGVERFLKFKRAFYQRNQAYLKAE